MFEKIVSSSQMTRVFLVSCAIGSFFIAINPPSLWAINYYLPSFFEGFYRRALIGTVLSVFGEYRFNYYFIASLQSFVLLALTFFLFKKVTEVADAVKWIFGAYLVSNFGIPYWTLIGCADQAVYLLFFLSLRLPDRYALAVMAITPLIHELAVFTVIPLFLVFGLLNGKRVARLFGEVMLFMAVFAVIYVFFQSVPDTRLIPFEQKVSGYFQCNFSGYYDIYRHSFTGGRMKNYYADYQTYLTNTGESYTPIANEMYIYIGILSLAFFCVFKLIRNDNMPQWKQVVAVLVVCYSPLALGFFGWDFFRWIHLASFSAIILVLYYYRATAYWHVILSVILIIPSFCLNSYFLGSPDDSARIITPEKLTIGYWQQEMQKPACPVK